LEKFSYIDVTSTKVNITIGVVSVAAEQREERVKLILDSEVITCLKTFLTPVPRSSQLTLRLIAELVKTGISTLPILRCSM